MEGARQRHPRKDQLPRNAVFAVDEILHVVAHDDLRGRGTNFEPRPSWAGDAPAIVLARHAFPRSAAGV